MVTIGHLHDAWTYALAEIDAAIFHLESGNGRDATSLIGDAPRAVEAWLVNLRRDRIEYNALLTEFPSVH